MKYFFAVFFYLLFQNAFSQHPVFYQVNDENGLPANEVYKVVQDDFGYIWIGCESGLFRYDGFNYKQYTNPKQNGRGISFLQIDSKKRIWCKNFYGQVYCVQNDSLKIIRHFKTSDPSYPQFTTDADCNLWVGNKNKLSVYNEKGDSIKSYELKKKNNRIIALKFFKGSLYLFLNDISALKFNVESGQFENLVSEKVRAGQSESCHIIEHLGCLYLLAETDIADNKYCIYKTDGKTFEVFHDFVLPDKDARIYSIYSDGIELWVSTSFGAFRTDKKQEILFPKEKISSILHDREGEYWFSTLQSGLFVIPQMEVNKYNSANSSVTDNNLVAIKSADKEHLLAGSYLGTVFELNTVKNEVSEKFPNSTERFIAVKSIKKNERYTVVSRGRLCIIENASGKQFFPPASNVRDMELLDDTAYIVLSGFIAKVCLSEMIRTLKVSYTYLNRTGGRAIEYDPENKLMYVLLGDGIYTVEGNGNWKELLDTHKEKITGSTLCYNNGIMWLAGISDGVYGFENKRIKFHFTDKDQLKENNVKTIKADGNDLWVSTENYLHRLNLENKTTEVFNTSQSVNPKDINAIEILGEKIYLATNKGLICFPKNAQWKNKVVPGISISSLFINDRLLDQTDSLILPFDNNNLKISVSSVALKSRGNYSFRYRLLGLDSVWNTISASAAYVLFSRIPSGTFTFQVKAMNEHGVSSSVKSIEIFVATPFWQRWWFYLVLVLTASFVVALFYNARIRFIRKKAELKNKVVVSQLTALKSQMNPHFMFNALNSIQDLVLHHDVKNSNLYISKFSSLMRKVLDASGTEKIALQEEIEILELYLDLEKLRFGSEFHFQITVADQIETENVFLPAMILQPFVENAIKHGLLHKKNAKSLTIEFALKDVLVCTITDNGIGRKRSEEIKKRQNPAHTSFATKATENRIDLLNSYSDQKYSFKIIDLEENGVATGTKVVISIPFSVS
ncbi:MAG: histidine kinase [Bacteroidia bacterium]|nr:histidine kinase [Bacteroidia bacterium]